jgi:AAHS family 3-hydroxyphenylpropionic acid transporter
MQTTTPPPGTAGSTKFITLLLCFIVALLEGLDLQSAGIAASGIGAEFKLLPPQIGGMFSAGLVGLLPSAIFGGWLSDRIGRRKVLVGSVLILACFRWPRRRYGTTTACWRRAS